MRNFLILLLLSIVGCKNSGQADNRKKTLDSIADYESERKHLHALHEKKVAEFRRLKKLIPYLDEYHTWFEITNKKKILNDPDDQSFHSIGIGESTSYNMMLSNASYHDTIGSCYILNISKDNDNILFETISQESNDTLIWKLNFISLDSITGEWSYKNVKDKKFTSLGIFVPEKFIQ